MKTRTIGEARLVVPDLDPRDLDVTTAPPTGDLMEVTVEGADWSRLRLDDHRIRASSLTDVKLTEAELRGVRLTGCRLERVDLSGARLSGAVIERCEFIDCRMTGIHLTEASLTNVVFERCRLDYAIIGAVRTTGPVAWSDCILNEATFAHCRLDLATLVKNSMRRLDLKDCDLTGTDLRQNDIKDLIGLNSLRGARLDITQLPSLAELAVRELGIEVTP